MYLLENKKQKRTRYGAFAAKIQSVCFLRLAKITEVKAGLNVKTCNCGVPAKAKTIQKYLGEGYDVVASMGHVRDLPKSKLGIDIEHGFRPDYVEIKGKEDLVQTLKKKRQEKRCDLSGHRPGSGRRSDFVASCLSAWDGFGSGQPRHFQ